MRERQGQKRFSSPHVYIIINLREELHKQEPSVVLDDAANHLVQVASTCSFEDAQVGKLGKDAAVVVSG